VLCRTIAPLPEDERRKIALFTNVQKEAVISAWTSTTSTRSR
jgi:CTP synthase